MTSVNQLCVRLGENKVFLQCFKNRNCLTAGVHQLKEWRDTTDADSAIDYNGTDLVLTGHTSSLWTRVTLDSSKLISHSCMEFSYN